MVGNKVDEVDKRNVDKTEAEELAKTMGMRLYETSAKANTGIDACMDDLILQVYKQKYGSEITSSELLQPNIILERPGRPSKSSSSDVKSCGPCRGTCC